MPRPLRAHDAGGGASQQPRSAVAVVRRPETRASRLWCDRHGEKPMPELQANTRAALLRVATSTLTGALNRRGLRSMFMHDVSPIRPDMARMVGIAFTMRFIPSREDKDGPGAPGRGAIQSQAMETCPPGHVLVVDSRGDARAASAGDLYVGRLKARGCAGIVTDGGLRDTEGIFKTGLPAYHRRASSPPSPIAHHPCDLNLPIGCGGVAVYPGDIVVGDCDGVVVIPPDIVDQVAQEALATMRYEEFAEAEVARGRALPGLFPVAGEEAKRDFEAWQKARGED
jgi:regulator of RNase E activity RraA